MSDPSPPDRRPPAPSPASESEWSSSVAEVLRDAERGRERQGRAGPSPRATTPMRVAAAGVAVALAAWLWILPPGWALPSAPPPLPAQVEDARLRMALYLQDQRIQAFRDERGRLPDRLVEVGETLPNVSYERLDARRYRLSAAGEHGVVVHDSDAGTPLLPPDAARRVGVGP